MKHTIQKLVALVCALAITMSWLPVIPVMAEDAVEEIGGSDWSRELKSGSYRLVGNIELTTTQTLDGNLTVDLAGYELKNTTTAVIFKVANGHTLTIRDSSGTQAGEHADGRGVVTGCASSTSGNGMIHVSSGTFNLEGGKLTGYKTTKACGAIRVNAGSVVNMSGGWITGNTCGAQGSVAMVDAGAAFHMTGGRITDNVSANYANAIRNGAAIYVAGKNSTTGAPAAIFTMSGGEISGNQDTGNLAYSCQIHNRGTATISGGVIGSENGATGTYAYFSYAGSTAALFLGGYDLNDPDGLDPVSGAYGGAPAIVV